MTLLSSKISIKLTKELKNTNKNQYLLNRKNTKKYNRLQKINKLLKISSLCFKQLLKKKKKIKKNKKIKKKLINCFLSVFLKNHSKLVTFSHWSSKIKKYEKYDHSLSFFLSLSLFFSLFLSLFSFYFFGFITLFLGTFQMEISG